MQPNRESSTTPLLGIDWGTSNRRAYLFGADGSLVRQHHDAAGILAVGEGNFEKSLADLLSVLELDRADIVMSGMVGSRNGWRQVPYLSEQTPLPQLSEAMIEVELPDSNVRCRIVPGYQIADSQGTPDVMRGEETQVLGAMTLGAPDGWFLLPGTHSKWVRVHQDRIADIVTFITGELFALLTQHGTLAGLMQEQRPVAAAFEAGLKAAQQGALTHMLFSCRALVVTGAMPAEHAWSYLSGLLIGAELTEIRQRTARIDDAPIQLIGSPALAGSYVEALEHFGMSASVWQPDDVYVAAMRVFAGPANG